MYVSANFTSRQINDDMKIFRHDTALHSSTTPGTVIGLVYMMNPGSARPESDEIFEKLQQAEFSTEKPVVTLQDNTMRKVARFVELAYEKNDISLPQQYTIHIENLFNLREANGDKAKSMVKKLTGIDELLFENRVIIDDCKFIWLAWGKNNIEKIKQADIMKKYPHAISVRKLNYREQTIDVQYPVHPLYMNKDFFLEAAMGKIKP